MSKKLAIILFVASVLLLIGDVIFAENFGTKFWLSILSSVSFIILMIFIIRAQNKAKK